MRIKSRQSGSCFLAAANQGIQHMKAPDKDLRDFASPLDLWEMMIVAWIRLSASSAHAFAGLLMPRREAAGNEPDRERILAEKQELLLHVLE